MNVPVYDFPNSPILILGFFGILVAISTLFIANNKYFNSPLNRDKKFLNPKTDSARIRAMYTHPNWIRKGVGSLVITLGENAARESGFKKCELMATLSGELLYEAKGYKSTKNILYKTGSGKTVPMVRMEKEI